MNWVYILSGKGSGIRNPQATLTVPPGQFDSGFVISMQENPALGRVAEIYTVAKDKIYLLCKGEACKQ